MCFFSKRKSNRGSEKKSTSQEVDPRALRYFFDYEIVPSFYTHCVEAAFWPENKKIGSFGEGEFIFNNKGYEELEQSSRNELFGIDQGQISICKFPESEFSPSVIYAISFLRMKDYLASVKEKTSFYPPYYILSKMPGGFVIGRIVYEEESEHYYSEYYEHIDNPDLLLFLKWVVDREHITIKPASKGDPISDFLSGC